MVYVLLTFIYGAHAVPAGSRPRHLPVAPPRPRRRAQRPAGRGTGRPGRRHLHGAAPHPMVGRKEDALLAVDHVLGTLTQYAVGDATGDSAGDRAGLVGRLLCV